MGTNRNVWIYFPLIQNPHKPIIFCVFGYLHIINISKTSRYTKNDKNNYVIEYTEHEFDIIFCVKVLGGELTSCLLGLLCGVCQPTQKAKTHNIRGMPLTYNWLLSPLFQPGFYIYSIYILLGCIPIYYKVNVFVFLLV